MQSSNTTCEIEIRTSLLYLPLNLIGFIKSIRKHIGIWELYQRDQAHKLIKHTRPVNDATFSLGSYNRRAPNIDSDFTHHQAIHPQATNSCFCPQGPKGFSLHGLLDKDSSRCLFWEPSKPRTHSPSPPRFCHHPASLFFFKTESTSVALSGQGVTIQ